jgi:hypothetical protein
MAKAKVFFSFFHSGENLVLFFSFLVAKFQFLFIYLFLKFTRFYPKFQKNIEWW